MRQTMIDHEVEMAENNRKNRIESASAQLYFSN